jgi:hypothetical protein
VKLWMKILLMSILVCLAAGCAIFTAVTTVQALRSFQDHHRLAVSGAVQTIRPWMTVPYVAHTYHVPEKYLYRTLRVPDTPQQRHITLHMFAARFHQTDDYMVAKIERAVEQYRKQPQLYRLSFGWSDKQRLKERMQL